MRLMDEETDSQRSAGGVRQSLLRPGTNCCALVHASRAATLVDGDAYFRAFVHTALRAQRSIIILAWDFDSRALLYAEEDAEPLALGDFLNGLVKRNRSLRVHVLDWDYPMIFGHDRELSPRFGLSWKPHRRVHFRFDDTHPVAGSHHQKIVVIDDRLAFVGGLDLTTKRWDTCGHLPGDARRIARDKSYPPFHDVMLAVDGEAARALAGIARERWRVATGETLPAVNAPGDPWPAQLETEFSDVKVGLACTYPAAAPHEGVRDIEQLYLDMIAAAKRYIYLENQYFTAQRIGDALAARLAQDDCPEIVVVTRLLSHGWLEEMTMHVLRTRLIERLRAADHAGRFHIYYAHREGLDEGTCIDVHSKLMIVDDEWLRIGSANLSNRSMGLDTECDAVIEAGGTAGTQQSIRAFRDRLLAEHLDLSPDEVEAAVVASGSLAAAIAQLSTGARERTLKPLEDMPQWSDAVISAAAMADPEQPVSVEAMVEQFAPGADVQRAAPVWKKLALAALVLLGLAAVWRYTPLANWVTAETVIQWAERFRSQWWAPLVILIAYTPASIVMFPRPLITLAAIVAFGTWLGIFYSMSGILLAALATYLGGMVVNRRTIRRIAGTRLKRLGDVLRKRGLLAMTAVRLVPIAPFAVVGLVAGAIRVRLWHFMVGTFLGMLPGALIATIFGDQVQAALRDPAQVNYWLGGGLIVLLVIGAVLVGRWLSRATTISAAGEKTAGS